MAAFNTTSALEKIGLTGFISRVFVLLVVRCQFFATAVIWTEPPPRWTQKDSDNIRTVDIYVLKGSTQVPLRWNYNLTDGSDLKTTTFSIDDGTGLTDVGVKYHPDNSQVIYDTKDYKTRFNISESDVATLIINKATDKERAIFQCKLSTLSTTWAYRVRVNFTERHLNWVERPLSFVAVERHNITLQWTYMKTLGLSSSFRQAKFTDLRDGSRGKTIAEKLLNSDPFVHPPYRDRFRVDNLQDTRSSITIFALQRSDSGRYKFEVETIWKDSVKLDTLSSIVELSVQYGANMTNVSDHQTVQEGSYLQLFCEASGNPTPNITWTKVLENSNDSEVLHHGPTWNFTTINRTASGNYNCTAYNGIGNPAWHLTNVNVTYPAKVVKLASEHQVAVQQNVILHCEAEGNPQPTYTWTPCDPQGQVCYESTLNISNVLNDSVYSCKVTNLLGNDTRNTSVVIASSVINVTLVITNEECPEEPFTDSPLWTKLKKTIDELFKSEESYKSTEPKNYRCGSVIVDLALEFNSTVRQTRVLSVLRESAKNGELKEFGVTALAIEGIRPGRPTAAPNTTPTSVTGSIISTGTPVTPVPEESEDDKPLTDWMIAVIAGVGGAALLIIVILLLYWINKSRKNTSGDENIDMSHTSSYVVGGPYVSHSTDRRSYGMESVEDDPFIAASTQSLNSVDGRDKKKDSSVNYGYLPDYSVPQQTEMLLNPGSRLSKNDRLTQSTGELDVTSTYLAKGPQRDFSTLPSYPKPPAFGDASSQNERKLRTGPRQGKSSDDRRKRPQGPMHVRPEEAIVEPSKITLDQQGHGDASRKGPLDPTAIYAMPEKKNKSNKPRPEAHGSALGPPPQYTPKERPSKDAMLQNPGDLDLDDPSSVPSTEGPSNLILPIAMLPSNRAMPNQGDTEHNLPEPWSTLHRPSRNNSNGALPNKPERHKLPYINVRGQLVKPDSLSRSSRDSLNKETETLQNQWEPSGSQSLDRGSTDTSCITYVV